MLIRPYKLINLGPDPKPKLLHIGLKIKHMSAKYQNVHQMSTKCPPIVRRFIKVRIWNSVRKMLMCDAFLNRTYRFRCSELFTNDRIPFLDFPYFLIHCPGRLIIKWLLSSKCEVSVKYRSISSSFISCQDKYSRCFERSRS